MKMEFCGMRANGPFSQVETRSARVKGPGDEATLPQRSAW